MQSQTRVYDSSFPKKHPPRKASQQQIPKRKLSRLEQEELAAAMIEMQQRVRWRENPVLWCRERVNLEPSWKVLSAQALKISIEEFSRKYDGLLEDKLVEILESLRDNRKTHVRSGHQIGKTVIAAAGVLWFADCFRPSRVLTTSATWTDVERKLWGHIRRLYHEGGSWFGIDINQTSLNIADTHYVLGLSPDKVEPFQGHNDRHVLVAFDEASSIEQKFFDAAEAEATRMLAIGNPLVASGPFYTESKNSEWHHVQVSCFAHPNYIFKTEVIPGGPRYDWVEGRKKPWGYPKGPLWLSRVEGEFPEESADTLFSLSVIRHCFDLYKKVRDLPRDQEGKAVLGLDVARAGGDQTIGYESDCCKFNDKIVRRAHVVLQLAMTEHHKTRLEVQMLHKRRDYDHCNIDAGGEGSGLADELVAARGEAPRTNRVLFGSNATDEDYFNVRAEMYWQLSNAMKAGNFAIEENAELEEELSVIGGMRSLKEKAIARKRGVKQATYWLPPKEEISALLGRSPDHADGLCLANYKSASCGLFELWEKQASGEKPPEKMETGELPVAKTVTVGDSSSPEHRQKVWSTRMVEAELLRSAPVVRTAPRAKESPKCPACGGVLSCYAESWECGSCGLTNRTHKTEKTA